MTPSGYNSDLKVGVDVAGFDACGSSTQNRMGIISHAFKSKASKALEYYGLGTKKQLTEKGRQELLDFFFLTGSFNKDAFLKKITEAWEEDVESRKKS